MTFDDGTTVTKENYHLYFRNYRKENYSDYKYCIYDLTNSNYSNIICTTDLPYSTSIVPSSATIQHGSLGYLLIKFIYDSGNYEVNMYGKNTNVLIYSMDSNSLKKYNFDFDIYTQDNQLFKSQSIFYNDIDYYNLTFTSSLSGYSVVVRDSNNTIINSTNNIYKLQSGKEYSYVATRSGYKNIEGTITLNQDKEIELNFIPYVDTSSIISIYSDFLNTLKSMVSVIYESQLILFLIGVILVYALVYLIINLLGGRL